MNFKTDLNSFNQNHPYVSILSLGIVPVLWVAIGRFVSWLIELTGTSNKVAGVAQQMSNPQAQQSPSLRGRVTNGILDVPSDGNCLYAAFAAVVHGDPSRHREVRLKVSNAEAQLLNKFCDQGKTVEEINEEIETLSELISSGALDKKETESAIKSREEKVQSMDAYTAITTSFEIEKETQVKKIDLQILSLRQAYMTGDLNKSEYEELLKQAKNEKNAVQNTSFEAQEYINKTATDRVYGKTAEILALTMAYPVSIYIYTKNQNGEVVLQSDEPYGSGKKRVNLLMHGEHYQVYNPK